MPNNSKRPERAVLKSTLAKLQDYWGKTSTMKDFFNVPYNIGLTKEERLAVQFLQDVNSGRSGKASTDTLDAEELGLYRTYVAMRNDTAKRAQEPKSTLKDYEQDVVEIDKQAEKLVKAAPSDQAQSTAQQTQGATTPTTTPGSTDDDFVVPGAEDPTAFQGVFLNDSAIEDLARTGEFDIGPKEIAALFPTAAVQQSEQDQDPTTGPSLLDQLAPEQYRNQAFVNTGVGGLAQANPASMQRNQIEQADLPDWEKKVLLAEVDKNTPLKSPMTQEEYERRRMEIFNRGSVGPERALALAQLAQEKQSFDVDKAQRTGTSSLRDVVGKPYAMTSSEVSAAAVALFKAGYLEVPNYDPSKKLSEQMSITSAFDPNFQKAWNSWVGDSFKDRSKTMTDILQERQTNFTSQLQLYAQAIMAKRQEAAGSIKLSDPASLREHGDSIAQQEIGRKLTDVEHNQLVGYVQHLQQASQQALLDGATVVEDVDPDARLLEAIRANNPVASDSTDVVEQYNMMKSLLGGPRAAI